jgi:CRP/FNR family cyclic AMP-dependent transcriptional regulator
MPMTRKDKIALLRGVELFSDLGARALGVVADAAVEVSHRAGQYIVRQGQVGTGFYVVASGHVRVVRSGRLLERLGPGGFFGELSVIDQAPRAAHVIAEEATTCVALASWEFTRLLERHPKIALAVLRTVARRLRATTDHTRH